jgi:dephospho-CoA kinase
MTNLKINHYKWDLNNAKIIVAVTGTIASGKTTFANSLGKMGALVLNADKHAISQLEKNKPVYAKITKKFAGKSLNPDKTINKAFLARKIFSNKKLRIWLENIIHPYVLKKFKTEISKTNKKIIICDIPLLFEKNLADWFHLTVCVNAESKIRFKRAQKKGWTKNQFYKRSKNQLPGSEKMLKADINIDNSGTLPDLNKKAKRFYLLLKSLK